MLHASLEDKIIHVDVASAYILPVSSKILPSEIISCFEMFNTLPSANISLFLGIGLTNFIFNSIVA